MLEHIRDARELLAELGKAGGSEVRYTHILAMSVEKCERAVQEMQEPQHTPGHRQSLTAQSATEASEMNIHDTASTLRSVGVSSVAQQDLSPLETYVPQELRFEWAFPGTTQI